MENIEKKVLDEKQNPDSKSSEVKTEKVPGQTEEGPRKSSKLPLPLVIAFGCLGLLIISGIIWSIVASFFVKKIGTALIQKGIENKTGIKVETQDEEEGFSFTDTKTGSKVNLGAKKIPDNFPKSFPLYPGAKPSGSFSGSNQQDQSFWVMLSTDDSLDAVIKYYEDNLSRTGWGGKELLKVGNSVTWEVKKDLMAGSLTVSREENDKETKIMVILGNENDKEGNNPSASEILQETETGVPEE